MTDGLTDVQKKLISSLLEIAWRIVGELRELDNREAAAVLGLVMDLAPDTVRAQFLEFLVLASDIPGSRQAEHWEPSN